MIRQLIYVSNSSHFETESELEALLSKSRANNTKAGISGMLLFHDGLFLQVLEGPADAVQTTFDRIKDDSRHRSCRIMADLTVEQREFPDWSMGYEKTTGTLITGFNNLMIDYASRPATQSVSEAQKILDTFRAHAASVKAA